MAINAEEYRGRFSNKTIEVESGVEFVIGIISPLDLWSEKKTEAQAINISNLELLNRILLAGVVSPKLSKTDEEGALNVNRLKYEHRDLLSNEILKLSGIVKDDGAKKDFISQEEKV